MPVTPEQIAKWRSTADLDARAGAPVGKALREAADEVERLSAELTKVQHITEQVMVGKPPAGIATAVAAMVHQVADAWEKRARDADAEVERLTKESDEYRTANTRMQEINTLRAKERDESRDDVRAYGRVLLQARETLNGTSQDCPQHGDTFPTVLFGCAGCHQAAAVRNTLLAIGHLLDEDEVAS